MRDGQPFVIHGVIDPCLPAVKPWPSRSTVVAEGLSALRYGVLPHSRKGARPGQLSTGRQRCRKPCQPVPARSVGGLQSARRISQTCATSVSGRTKLSKQSNWFRRLWSLEESQGLRALGLIVLVVGVVGSCVFYLVQIRSAPPQMDELSAPGYLRARGSQQRIMMGPMGAILTDWQDTLQRPAVQAVIIAGLSVLVSWGFLKVASRLDEEREEDSSRPSR
jgi:hypothetical protein